MPHAPILLGGIMHFSYRPYYFPFVTFLWLLAIALSGINTPLFYFMCGASFLAALVDFINLSKHREISIFLLNNNKLLYKGDSLNWCSATSFEIISNDRLFFHKITLQNQDDIYSYTFFIRPKFNMPLNSFLKAIGNE